MGAERFKAYYYLTKPGIIRGNVMTTAAGFLLAAQGDVDWRVLLATLVGTALIIAAACVFNNYIDREIDTKMTRTKKRALVTGLIMPRSAIIYGVILCVAGFAILILFVNMLTVLAGFLAILSYVVFYGIAKRRSPHGTLVGTVPGALPMVGGYVAVTNQLDLGALLLFLSMVFWQMPHFYGIAMYRLADYKAAGIPVWPAVKGLRSTKYQIMGYVLAFTLAVAALSYFDYTGLVFAIVMVGSGLVWLGKGYVGFSAKDDVAWGRGMFLFSLVVLLVFSVMLSVDPFIP